MEASSKNVVTINALVEGQIKFIRPLFDQQTEYIFWGSLIHAMPVNGIDTVQELSGIPKQTLENYMERFNSLGSSFEGTKTS